MNTTTTHKTPDTMKTMIAKFPGTCRACNQPIRRGDAINFYGRGHAEHAHHTATATTPGAVVAPCWLCKDPNGRFRNYGAATPVYCDACHEKERRLTGPTRYEPDRFDMMIEDQMRAACGC